MVHPTQRLFLGPTPTPLHHIIEVIYLRQSLSFGHDRIRKRGPVGRRVNRKLMLEGMRLVVVLDELMCHVLDLTHLALLV